MQQKRDSEIEQWVLKELSLSREIDSAEICVLSNDGLVTLKGTVYNHHNRHAAGNAARLAPGVLGVLNLLTVTADVAIKQPAELMPEPVFVHGRVRSASVVSAVLGG